MTVPLYANDVATTLAAPVANGGVTAFTLADASGWPVPSAGEYVPAVVVDSLTTPETIKEYVWITGLSGTTATVVRAAEDSARFPAAALASGLTIAAVATATALAGSQFDRAGAATTAQANAESYADAGDNTRQPLDSDLTAIAAINSASAGALVTDGTGWIKKTYAQLKAALGITVGDVAGLGSAATHSATDFDTAGAASAAQAASAQKTANLSDLTDAATARTNLGLGTAATQPSSAFDTTGAAAAVQTNLAAEVTRAQAAEAALGGGMQFRTAVVVATSNQALSGLPTIDGVTLTAGQAALLIGQTAGSQNGLWAVASGAWTRPSNFAAGSDATATSVLVESGTAGSGTTYAVTGTTNNVVGTNVLTFVKTSGSAASSASPVRIGVEVVANNGRVRGYVDLLPDDDGLLNCLSGVVPLCSYGALNSIAAIEVFVPAFAAGTLQIAKAELNIYNPDWTQAISLGVDVPIDLTSGQGGFYVPFDNVAEENAKQGTDLTASAGDVVAVTTAGGVFTGSWMIRFATVGLTAPNP